MELIVANLENHFNSLRKNANVQFADNSSESLEKKEMVSLAQTQFTRSSFGSVRPIKHTASGVSYGQPSFFSPVYTPMNWQIPSRRRELYMWCRFFYENEPRLATCLDFYSRFPISGFETECSNRYVKHYFDQLNKKLNLDKWARIISHEVHLIGDCFPFLEVECESCGGSGRVDGEVCDHKGGSFKRILILNPDFVEVFTNSIAPEDVITYVPDDELKDLVMKNGPGVVKLSNDIKKLIVSGRPIPLDNLCVSHLKFAESGYRRYGISMIRRLFPILSYKTKIMSAQWIVAERLIIPIKVVKVGSDDRPASDADIASVQSQIMASSNDPNVCIVTHHAFDLDFYSGAGKILQVNGEYEFINQEIMDGFGLNKQLITGEGPCFHPDVEILTEVGWKKYDEVKDNEKLATFNPKNNSLEYQHFKNRIIKQYDDELVHFKTNKIDMLVTKNHRMWINPRGWRDGKEGYYEWKVEAAEDVKHRARMRACIDFWEGEIPEEYSDGVDFGGVRVSLEDFVRVLGYYISEGYVSKNNGSVSQKTGTDSCGRIEEVFLKSGIPHGHWSCKNGMDVFSLHKPQREWIIENIPGKAKQKFIPLWVKNLPVEYLEILLDALIDGDGSIHSAQLARGSIYRSYISSSKRLADDVMEIAFKLGYSPTISFARKEEEIYVVNISSSNIGKFPVLDTLIYGESSNDRRKCISRIPYNGTVWCFEVPNEFLIVRYNGKPLVCGNTYSSAAMGAEIMIRRLESWRLELKRWIEERIYLPVAKMMGFVEKNEWGEEEYIYPKIKWDNLNLRDRQNERQLLLQLYDKGLISAKRLLEEFEIDPDNEFEQIRFERIEMMSMQPPGQAGQESGGGGMMGGLGDLGGGGGGGGLSMGGGMESSPSGGESMGGDMGGEPSPGSSGGAPPAPTANSERRILTSGLVEPDNENGIMRKFAANNSDSPVDPSTYGGKILTPETRDKLDKMKAKYKKTHPQHSQSSGGDGFARDTKGRIIMTSIERDVIKGVEDRQRAGQIHFNCIPSYEVFMGSRPILIDLAFPSIKLAIECDGGTFHGSPEQKKRDQIRDRKLNNLGWIVLRFTDDEIKHKLGSVLDRITREVTKREVWLNEQRKNLEEKRKKEVINK